MENDAYGVEIQPSLASRPGHSLPGARIQYVSDSAAGEEVLPAPTALRGKPSVPRAERALVRAAKHGSVAALDELVTRHWDAAHRAAYLIVQDAGIAEDIAQEAMVSTIQALDRFDWRRPLRPYLHRAVVNRSLDWLRARRTRPEVSLEGVEPLEAPVPPNSGESQLPGALLSALALLEPEDRAAIVLRHVLDYRAREVAEFLGIEASTARSRLGRALERLRAALEVEGDCE
jgi:RNA polymerase sigma-70 factor, ECF subfamily